MEKIKKRKYNWRNELPFLLILLPAVVIVFLMSYVPLFGLLLAFKEEFVPDGVSSGLGIILKSGWNNFAYFEQIFSIPDVAQAIWNTFYINILTLLFEFPAPIILAILISEVGNKAYKKTVQTISYLPHFLSMAAITGIVNTLLRKYGLIDSFMDSFGIEIGTLYSNPDAFLPTYIIVDVWMTVGWNSIIYLASITGINGDLYEAASLDGANRWEQTIFITLPSLLPTAMMLLILRTGSLLSSNFELVYGLQVDQWKVGNEVIATWVYRNGLGGGQYGLASALSLFQGAVALFLTLSTNFISKKVADVSMW